jgi:predicted AlkP superfamily phosphohydrolase/phosphomutase
LIRNYYKKIDNFLGEFLKKDYTIVFVSDHGFVRNDIRSGPRITAYKGRYINFLCNYMLYKLGVLNFHPPPSGVITPEGISISDTGATFQIDFSRTQAYFFNNLEKSQSGIAINKMGRNPQGQVKEEEFLGLRERIYAILRQAHFSTGQKVFADVRKANPQIGVGPDIVFSLSTLFKEDNLLFEDKGAYLILKGLLDNTGRVLSEIILEDKAYPLSEFINLSRAGNHIPSGIVMLKGQGILKGKLIRGARNVDIAPTILYLFGRPLARDFDGRVLTQAIEPEFLKRNPVRYIQTYERNGEDLSGADSSEEGLQIDDDTRNLLRSLGYLQ